jgi:hypothetical protein
MTPGGWKERMDAEQAHGLDEFSKESDSAPPVPVARDIAPPPPAPGGVVGTAARRDARGASLRLLHSPALVPILLVLAVLAYGAFAVVWWERDRPRIGMTLSSPAVPTQSFQPTAPAPASAPPPVPVAKETAAPATPSVPVAPAVARVEGAPHRIEPPPVRKDAVEDPHPTAPPAAVPEPATAVAATPAPEAVVAAPPRVPEPTAVERVVTDRDAIGDVLQSYRTAYNTLDATSASTIWQGVDTRALQRAFATLSQQTVSFDRCDVRVTTADRAVASCRGVLQYVPKIGDGSPQQRRLSWDFDFTRAANRWMIASVSAK